MNGKDLLKTEMIESEIEKMQARLDNLQKSNRFYRAKIKRLHYIYAIIVLIESIIIILK
jgi:cell division protein FtsB